MACRVAAGMLAHLLPVAAGTSHEPLRRHTFKRGERLREAAAVAPTAPAPAITISLDPASIRSCHEGERHLEVRVPARGADLPLQVRCALCNGALGFGFGQLFEPVPSAGRQSAAA